MPELPEVETVVNGIQTIKHKTIKNVIVRQYKLRYPIPTDLAEQIIGTKIKEITRRAKYILIHLNNNKYLICHLGMTGSLLNIDINCANTPNTNNESNYKNNNSHHNTTVQKHDHFDIIFADESILRYNDPRKFGFLIVSSTNPNSHHLLSNLGVEPLSSEFNTEYLQQKLINKKSTIKQLIMYNKIVVGVGNIYACEALFKAKISPLRLGSQLSLTEINKLVISIKSILHDAIKFGGSSIQNFKQTDGRLGYFQRQHNVYGKKNQPCKNCNSLIEIVKLGGRSTFFCKTCQH